MAFDISSSATPRMLIVRGHGVGTSDEGHRAFQQLQHHADYCQGVPILVDLTALDYQPSPVETRMFAGLFATAFPCSLLALVCDARSYPSAREITHLAISRGATIATFTDRAAALAYLMGKPEAAAPMDTEPPRFRRASLRRVAEGVVITYGLREKIENALIEVDGHDCPLRLDSAAGRPAQEPDFAEVTVSTEYAGASRLATVDLRVSSLDDEDYVVATVVNAMKAVLAGAGQGWAVSASAVPH